MKKPLIYFLIALLCLTFFNCKENQNNMQPEELRQTGVVVMQSIDVTVRNKLGEDLLNPANEYRIKEFKIYYLVNGAKKLYYNANMDASSGYRLLKHPSKGNYYLNILMNGSMGVLKSTTFLQLGNAATLDTISTQYRADPNNIVPEKIWFNGRLAWKIEDGEPPVYEIIRE